MNLEDTVTLRAAGIYGLAANPGELLPLVFGDFMSEYVVPPATVGGITPAVLIDRLQGIYLVNDARSHTDVPQVYVEDVLQATSVYAYNPNVDIESKGRFVAVIQFTSAVVNAVVGKRVSVRMKGAVDPVSGALITNPILALKFFFLYAGNWVEADFDHPTTTYAAFQCDSLGYTAHYVFDRHATYGEWLTELQPQIHADVIPTYEGTLAILIDSSTAVPPELIGWHFDAAVDLEGADPEDNPRVVADIANIATVLVIHYQYNWVSGKFDAHTDPPVRLESWISSYGERVREINLPGVRSPTHLNSWGLQYVLKITGLPSEIPVTVPTTVHFSVPTTQWSFLLPGTYVTLSWTYGPHPLGTGWVKRILKIQHIRNDPHPWRPHSALDCWDTGLSYMDSTYVLMTDQSGATRYLSVDEEGNLRHASTNPGRQRLNPTPAAISWIERTAPNATLYYLYPGADEGLIVSPTQPGVGSGLNLVGELVNRFSQRFQLEVTNDEEYFVRRVY